MGMSEPPLIRTQDAVFVPTLSAWETLHFSAVLRTPGGVPRSEIKRRMQDTLAVMGLSRVAHTQVHTLSPGPVHYWLTCADQLLCRMPIVSLMHLHNLRFCRGSAEALQRERKGNFLLEALVGLWPGGRAAGRRHPCEGPQR